MYTKVFCTFCFQYFECFKQLLRCHTVLGITRVVHDIIANLKQSAWVVTATDCLRNMANCLLQEINVREII
mgnify:CR=1 FL=1